jgi:hypothetical protein
MFLPNRSGLPSDLIAGPVRIRQMRRLRLSGRFSAGCSDSAKIRIARF